MGKYSRKKFTGLIFVDPDRLAEQVWEAFRRTVETHIDEMVNNYREQLPRVAESEEKLNVMKTKLANWYRDLRPIAQELRDNMAKAKEAYAIEKSRVLREIYA